jgi:hypothetical protein
MSRLECILNSQELPLPLKIVRKEKLTNFLLCSAEYKLEIISAIKLIHAWHDIKKIASILCKS